MDVGGFLQGSQSFLLASDGNRKGEALQVIPLFNLRGPGIPGYPERGYDENGSYFEAVMDQLLDGSERDRRFA
jgi:hypothetical protein